MLGPWKSAHGAGTEAEATVWVSPDPLNADGEIYYSESTQRYTNGTGEYIYFEGTDPRNPGVPPFPGRPSPRERWDWEQALSDAVSVVGTSTQALRLGPRPRRRPARPVRWLSE